jgi:hypothetical protein
MMQQCRKQAPLHCLGCACHASTALSAPIFCLHVCSHRSVAPSVLPHMGVLLHVPHYLTDLRGEGCSWRLFSGPVAAHTCAVLTNGTARCWGWNAYGKPPHLQKNLLEATCRHSVRHSCGVTEPQAYAMLTHFNICFTAGGLGDGTTDHRNTPTPVSELSGIVSIATGGMHTCAVLANRTAYCWGYGYAGES